MGQDPAHRAHFYHTFRTFVRNRFLQGNAITAAPFRFGGQFFFGVGEWECMRGTPDQVMRNAGLWRYPTPLCLQNVVRLALRHDPLHALHLDLSLRDELLLVRADPLAGARSG